MLFDKTLKEEPRVTKHAEAFCWIEYSAKNEPADIIRVFNAVDEAVPLVLKLRGREYDQRTFTYTQVYDYTPADGDLVFRRLKNEEQDALVKLWVKGQLRLVKAAQRGAAKGFRVKSRADLTREARGRYRHQTIVVSMRGVKPLP